MTRSRTIGSIRTVIPIEPISSTSTETGSPGSRGPIGRITRESGDPAGGPTDVPDGRDSSTFDCDDSASVVFPGADDLGNMFQFKADFNEMYCGNRPLALSRSLNPKLQTFAQWLNANAKRIPL